MNHLGVKQSERYRLLFAVSTILPYFAHCRGTWLAAQLFEGSNDVGEVKQTEVIALGYSLLDRPFET